MIVLFSRFPFYASCAYVRVRMLLPRAPLWFDDATAATTGTPPGEVCTGLERGDGGAKRQKAALQQGDGGEGVGGGAVAPPPHSLKVTGRKMCTAV